MTGSTARKQKELIMIRTHFFVYLQDVFATFRYNGYSINQILNEFY